jgi:tRNA-Thr(GGU) m(6)t(6)A37 methyltransferase TsaA
MELQPIAIVKTGVVEPTDENWAGVISELHVDPGYTEGLRGIEDFSHALIVFWMHRAAFDAATDLVRRPRGRDDMPETGIFVQRAKHRPNPIGITAVRILGCEGAVLSVRGLDAIDGTPVLDIKPYVPAFDRVDDARTPAWIDEIMKDYF